MQELWGQLTLGPGPMRPGPMGPEGKGPKNGGPKKGAQRKGTIFIDGCPAMNSVMVH